MDIVNYFESRRIGALDSGWLKRKSGNNNIGKLNINFLLSKMRCNWEDDHLTIGIGQSPNTIPSLNDEDFESLVPAFSAKFCRTPGQEHFLAISNEEGTVNILNTNFHGDKTYVSSLRAHDNAVFDVSWVPGESNILTVSGDKTASLWDMKEEKKICSFYGHKGSIKWADFRPMDKTVFATAARDGCIIVWDARTQTADNIIRNCHTIPKFSQNSNRKPKSPSVTTVPDVNHSVTAVLFQDEYTLISAGSSDGNIKVWDIRKHYSNHKQLPLAKHVIARKNSKTDKTDGYSSLLLDSSRQYLFASSCNNVIYQYDCALYSSTPVATFTGHQNRTFFVKSAISPDDQYLLSGSSDNYAYIWAISQPGEPVFKLDGHEAEVTAVAWSMDPVPRIATCGDDMHLKLWHSWPDGVPVSSERPLKGRVMMTPKSETVLTKTPCRPIKVRRLFTESSASISTNRSPTKRLKRLSCQENLYSKTTPSKRICSPKAILSPSKMARNEDNIRRKLAFDESFTDSDDCITPKKAKLMSPTFNLPNSVLNPNPKPNTMSPLVKSKVTRCKANWLTQIGQQDKVKQASPQAPKTKSISSNKRKLNRISSPRNAKKPKLNASQTILHYFTVPPSIQNGNTSR